MDHIIHDVASIKYNKEKEIFTHVFQDEIKKCKSRK